MHFKVKHRHKLLHCWCRVSRLSMRFHLVRLQPNWSRWRWFSFYNNNWDLMILDYQAVPGYLSDEYYTFCIHESTRVCIEPCHVNFIIRWWTEDPCSFRPTCLTLTLPFFFKQTHLWRIYIRSRLQRSITEATTCLSGLHLFVSKTEYNWTNSNT